MKGIILAGGTGSRLHPMTRVTNKHLLPVYNKPMIMHPLNLLRDAGIREIMIVAGKGHAGHFLELLGSGKENGLHISYGVQEKPGGIAEALSITEDFADGEPVTVILGDNIFEYTPKLEKFQTGAKIFLKKVENPQRFGVATLNGDTVVKIVEKPKKPASSYAVTGIYQYDAQVYDHIRDIMVSERGELEITDVNNKYIENGTMSAEILTGFWTDAGTVESLFKAGMLVRERELRNNKD